MKTIVIGEGAGLSLEEIMSVYPRHKIVADKFIESGDIIGIGPFADKGGNMAIFKTRQAAEQFVKEDPFILEGVIKSFVIKDWDDNLIP
ncbi:MAG: YciI family protein [Flavipsychrobacter sp.]